MGIEEYRVLIRCHNEQTGESFYPGDVVTEEDFSQEVIDNWLSIDPPVLEVIYGSNN